MIRANRLFFALALCALSSACGLIFDTDALRQTGATGGGGNAGNGGGPGGGAAGAGLPGGAGGNGGFGGAGNASNVGCEDPGYCGPGSACEPDGFCSVVSSVVPAGLSGLRFISGSTTGQNEGHVVAYWKGLDDHLDAWPLGFEQDQAALSTSSLFTDPGVGFITAGGANYVYYFGQGQNCDVDANDDSCISVCSVDAGGIDCNVPRILTGGRHLNGAVLVPGANPMQDSLYFLEATDASNEWLQRVSGKCLETNQQDCPAELAANYNAPDELDPLGLDYDPADGSLWWNTWGGSGFDNACVYRFYTTSPSSEPVDCVPTAPPINKPNRLAVSGAAVFVGTFGFNGAEPGPIQRLNR